MAIKDAERVGGGGGFIDLKALAGEKAKTPDDGTIAIFRIVAWDDEDPKNGDYGWDMPVTADVLVVDCAHNEEENGKVWMRQNIRFAPVYVLRGHAKPEKTVKLRDLPKPENDLGDEIITRIQLKGSGNEFVALQVPSKADKAAAMEARETAGGDDWGAQGDDLF